MEPMHTAHFALIQAETAPQTTETQDAPSPFSSILFPLAIMAILFWVVLLGPERKQRKKRELMLSALKKGDRVMTSGGLYGAVAATADDVITLQVADGVRLRFARSAITTVLEQEAPAEAEEKPKKT